MTTPTFAPVVVDAILALVVAEAVALVAWRARRARGPTVAQTLSFLGAGAALLVAVRAALSGWPAWAALAALLVGGLAHAAHVVLDARAAGLRDGPRGA